MKLDTAKLDSLVDSWGSWSLLSRWSSKTPTFK